MVSAHAVVLLAVVEYYKHGVENAGPRLMDKTDRFSVLALAPGARQPRNAKALHGTDTGLWL